MRRHDVGRLQSPGAGVATICYYIFAEMPTRFILAAARMPPPPVALGASRPLRAPISGFQAAASIAEKLSGWPFRRAHEAAWPAGFKLHAGFFYRQLATP